MKILWYLPNEFESVAGGAWIQINSMFQEINKIEGIQVDFHRVGLNPNDYDLVHLFRADTSLWALTLYLKSNKIPYWVTPIFYSTHHWKSLKFQLKLSQWIQKFIKAFRSYFDYTYDILVHAEKILPNTTHELNLIAKSMNIPNSQFELLYNGISHHFFQEKQLKWPEKIAFNKYHLNTGLLSNPRKNTLELIKAYVLLGEEFPLVLVGRLEDTSYGIKCLKLIQENQHILHLDYLHSDSDEYLAILQHAELYIQASLFETPGLSTLEAAAANCPIITTIFGGTQDYFRDKALYLEDLSASGIIRIIKQSQTQPNFLNKQIDPHYKDYRWDQVVNSLANQYMKRTL